MKVIEKRAVSTSKKLFLRVRREISNLKKLRHSNVVEIYESTYIAQLARMQTASLALITKVSLVQRLRFSVFRSGFETRSQFVIAMEYLPNGELFDYVWKRQGLGETEARELFRQIVEGVNCCHMVSYCTHISP